MSRVAGLRRALGAILRELRADAPVGTLEHPSRIREGVEAAMRANRRLMPDLLDVRSAAAMGNEADFYIWRRGSPNKVGRPAPLSARDEWEAVRARGDSGWGVMNPEHHWGVRVKDRSVISPELAYQLLELLYSKRQHRFSANSHGTTALVNLRLKDLLDLYGDELPPPRAQSVFKARFGDIAQHGFGGLDLRAALRATLEGE